MTRSKIFKESLKAGVVLGFLFLIVTTLIADVWWEPAWRRMPDAPDKTWPLLAAIIGFILGFIIEFRRRKNSKPGKPLGGNHKTENYP